jgi:hypothetical protein
MKALLVESFDILNGFNGCGQQRMEFGSDYISFQRIDALAKQTLRG